MENKQIVDDVQIRGCGHYWNGTCHAYTDNTGKFLLCVNSPHCYFKQLARKEQECEEKQKTAQDAINKLCAEKSALHNELDQLKAENIKFTLDTKNLVAQYSAKLKRLKQTLVEIKEIAKNMNKECFYDDFECKDCDMKNGCTYYSKKQILQKISECEVK